jgi:hypothetical protein
MSYITDVESIAFLMIGTSIGFGFFAYSLKNRTLFNIPMRHGWDRIAITVCFAFTLLKYWNPKVELGINVHPLWSLAILIAFVIATACVYIKELYRGVE